MRILQCIGKTVFRHAFVHGDNLLGALHICLFLGCLGLMLCICIRGKVCMKADICKKKDIYPGRQCMFKLRGEHCLDLWVFSFPPQGSI